MDKRQKPGIEVAAVELLECQVGKVNPGGDLSFNLKLTSLSRDLSEDKATLALTAAFDVMGGQKNPPCEFTCMFRATYTRPDDANMTWRQFTDGIAVAHLIPYVREFLSNMTTRLPLPVLMLPPTNAFRLVGDYARQLAREAKKAEGAAAAE